MAEQSMYYARAIAAGRNTYLALSGLGEISVPFKPRPLAWALLFRPFGAQGIA